MESNNALTLGAIIAVEFVILCGVEGIGRWWERRRRAWKARNGL